MVTRCRPCGVERIGSRSPGALELSSGTESTAPTRNSPRPHTASPYPTMWSLPSRFYAGDTFGGPSFFDYSLSRTQRTRPDGWQRHKQIDSIRTRAPISMWMSIYLLLYRTDKNPKFSILEEKSKSKFEFRIVIAKKWGILSGLRSFLNSLCQFSYSLLPSIILCVEIDHISSIHEFPRISPT